MRQEAFEGGTTCRKHEGQGVFLFFTSVILTGPAQVAILVDDMIATGARLALAAQSFKRETRTYALVSHGASPSHLPLCLRGSQAGLSANGIENLPLEMLVVCV